MKINNNKKKLPIIGTVLALASKVLANIWLVIAILVLIVGAIIIYNLIQVIRRKLPNDPPKSDITRIYLNDGTFAGLVYDNYDPATYYLTASSVTALDASQAVVPSFSLQYGLSDTNGPTGWLSAGTNMESVQFSDSVGNSLTDYSFTMTGYGQVFRITCVNGLYFTQVLDVNTNTYQVIVERTSDLSVSNWAPVFTNTACGVHSVENFADTNAPVERGFYRLNISTNSN